MLVQTIRQDDQEPIEKYYRTFFQRFDNDDANLRKKYFEIIDRELDRCINELCEGDAQEGCSYLARLMMAVEPKDFIGELQYLRVDFFAELVLKLKDRGYALTYLIESDLHKNLSEYLAKYLHECGSDGEYLSYIEQSVLKVFSQLPVSSDAGKWMLALLSHECFKPTGDGDVNNAELVRQCARVKEDPNKIIEALVAFSSRFYSPSNDRLPEQITSVPVHIAICESLILIGLENEDVIGLLEHYSRVPENRFLHRKDPMRNELKQKAQAGLDHLLPA